MVQSEPQLWTPDKDRVLHTAELGFEEFIKTPQRGDQTINSLGHAGLKLLQEEWFTDLLWENLQQRLSITQENLSGLIRAGFQVGVLHPSHRDRYAFTRSRNPFGNFRTPESIQKYFTWYLDPDARHNRDPDQKKTYGIRAFATNLQEHNLPTTTIKRYPLPIIIATLLQEAMPKRLRGDGDIRAMDAGSSLGLGMKWWSASELFSGRNPMDLLNIVSPRLSADGQTMEHVPEALATRRIRDIGRGALELGLGVCGDIMRHDDRDVIRLTESSFSPSEYNVKNPGHVNLEEFDLLTMSRPSNVLFYRDDFANLDFDRLFEEINMKLFVESMNKQVDLSVMKDRRFDVVMALTMLYELPPHMQQAVLQNLLKLAGEDGIVIIQDKIRIDENDPTKFTTDGISFGDPWCYRTIVIDPRNPVLRVWFISKSGRVEETMIGEDFGMLGDERILDRKQIFGLAA